MGSNGKEYWRSLDQLAETEEFKEFLHREFPKGTTELANNNWSRRSFLTLMGASLAMAGLASCRRPQEKIVPFVTRPEDVTPGVPLYYATTMPFPNGNVGLIATNFDGRPTQLAGNPKHTSSLGATDIFAQTATLGLYDPDRSTSVLHDGEEAEWKEFVTWWQEQYTQLSETRGKGLAVLSESFASPTLFRLREAFLKKFPEARWVAYEPISDVNILAGVKIATGEDVRPVYDFTDAKTIVTLDADILATENNNIVNARTFAKSRKVTSQEDDMSRLWSVESAVSVTGANADHRLGVKRSQIPAIAVAIAKEMKAHGLKLDMDLPDVDTSHLDQEWISTCASDLLSAGTQGVLVAGRAQSAEVHALVTAVNRALSSKIDSYYPVGTVVTSSHTDLQELAASMDTGEVTHLVMFGGNPIYNAPVDFKFADKIGKVSNVVHLSDRVDETSKKANWHVPRAHFLESWGDATSYDGSRSIVQPMIEPLFGGKSDVEFASLLSSGAEAKPYDTLRETWKGIFRGADFESRWQRTLNDGTDRPDISPTARKIPAVRVNARSVNSALTKLDIHKSGALEVVLIPGNTWDGRFANNGWLQELPDAITKVAWDNPAYISAKTAEKHDLKNGDMIRLSVQGRSLELPVWISPGQAEDTLGIALGYGRTEVGRVGNGVGFDSYKLRQSTTQWFAGGAAIVKLDRSHVIACTQDHGSMEGRPIVRENTLAGYKNKAEFYPEGIKHPPLKALWTEPQYKEGYQWGMSIDLNSCIGCNACVVACQSENNIPIVGKEQVHMGREMHWIRLDRYYAGDADNPELAFQPMNCQHCEMAPCESVCPVAATTHDKEGLNVMVYNRCIGTRYCSNNCPYKVRRFNFFNYTNEYPDVIKMAQNPEVTVRFRGVMEKCTYCTHRIQLTKYQARLEEREIADGELKTACQQSCPTDAISFGNLLDQKSKVAELKQNNRTYRVLEELNIKPRTSYMAKLRNPHPALAPTETDHSDNGHGHG